jgi:putative ATPase
MKQLDYGKGYEYAHNERDAVTGMDCLAAVTGRQDLLEPTERGFEKGDQRASRPGRDQAAARRRVEAD